MGKGKVIGTVAAAVVIPAAAVVGAIYILPLLDITSSNTLYYFGNDASVAADGTISLGKEEVLGYSSKYSDTMTGLLWCPTELGLKFSGVDGIALIATGAVVHMVEVVGVAAHELQNHAQHINVVVFAIGAHEVPHSKKRQLF